MVVRVGTPSRKFMIVNLIDANPIFNAYEAYAIHDKFVSSTPLALMAFVINNGDSVLNFTRGTYRLQMEGKNALVDRANFLVVYGGANVFHGKQANYISQAMLRNEIGHLEKSETEKLELDNLVNHLMRIIMLGNHSRMRILDDEAASCLFNGFVKKLEKKEYKECQEMIKMLDPGIIEEWTELFYRNHQTFWQ
jgi:hypothetical protein